MLNCLNVELVQHQTDLMCASVEGGSVKYMNCLCVTVKENVCVDKCVLSPYCTFFNIIMDIR